MTSATLTLTDRNGKLDMHVEYKGAEGKGLDIRIPSHEHMLLMIAALDQMAEANGEPTHVIMPSAGQSVKFEAAEDAHVLPTLKRSDDGQVIGWEAQQ